MAGLEDPAPPGILNGAGADGPDALARLLVRPVLQVAPRLLGAVVRREDADGVVAVRLTEVEAYAGEDDPGSHAFRGRTPRTAVMFGPPAHLYVYFSYGMHWCANVVTGPDGRASAVLLRAGEVVEGHDLARSRRPAARTDRDLARGPARLAQALGLTGDDDGADLRSSSVRLLPRGRAVPRTSVRTGPRVGVSGAGGDGATYPWRFHLADDPTVSTYRASVPRAEPRRR